MSTALQSMELLSPGGNLNGYLQAISRIPILTAEEERELAGELHDHGDLDAARKLIISHLRFVAHIARSYSGYGLPLEDLIQEGNIGLMKAVKRFDPGRGVRLTSFAVHWIKAEIHEFILRNWRIVRVATTKAQRKLFFNLRSKKRKLGWLSDAEADSIADELEVSRDQVREMEQRLSSFDSTFDAPAGGGDDDGPPSAPAYYLEDRRFEPERIVEQEEEDSRNRRLMHRAIKGLDARSRKIISRRHLGEKKATLQELATEHGVSIERIRQIEQSAIRKIRHKIASQQD